MNDLINIPNIKQFVGLVKSDIKLIAKEVVNSTLEKGNPLEIAEALSVLETFIKEVKADESFKEYTREEIAKYPKGYVSNSGAKLECAETGTKYDFSQCGDVIHAMYSQQLLSIQNTLKERETFLKTIPIEGMLITDENSGETYKIFPPAKSSISSYKITLSK